MRGTKILFYGCGLKLFGTLRKSNSKTTYYYPLVTVVTLNEYFSIAKKTIA